MNTETMTIHEALTTLKTLDNRILAKFKDEPFVTTKMANQSKVFGIDTAAFIADQKSKYESVIDLIKRRNAIRNAVAQSNAETHITVGSKEYTISCAIEMKKNGLTLQQQLVSHLTAQLVGSQTKIERANGETLINNANDYVQGLTSGKEKINIDEVNATRELYIKMHTLELIDTISAEKEIEKLNKEIDTFAAEVDAKISVSNALTTITVEY